MCVFANGSKTARHDTAAMKLAPSRPPSVCFALPVRGLQRLGPFSIHQGIPTIFDSVFWSPRQQFGDFTPTIPNFTLRFQQDYVFFVGPRMFFYAGIQMILPSFAALFTFAPRHMQSDDRPFFRTVSFHKFLQQLVLQRRPRAFDGIGFDMVHPSILNLIVGHVRQSWCLTYVAPFPFPVFFNSLKESLVALGIPSSSWFLMSGWIHCAGRVLSDFWWVSGWIHHARNSISSFGHLYRTEWGVLSCHADAGSVVFKVFSIFVQAGWMIDSTKTKHRATIHVRYKLTN